MSIAGDGPEEIVDAEEYLQPAQHAPIPQRSAPITSKLEKVRPHHNYPRSMSGSVDRHQLHRAKNYPTNGSGSGLQFGAPIVSGSRTAAGSTASSTPVNSMANNVVACSPSTTSSHSTSSPSSHSPTNNIVSSVQSSSSSTSPPTHVSVCFLLLFPHPAVVCLSNESTYCLKYNT